MFEGEKQRDTVGLRGPAPVARGPGVARSSIVVAGTWQQPALGPVQFEPVVLEQLEQQRQLAAVVVVLAVPVVLAVVPVVVALVVGVVGGSA